VGCHYFEGKLAAATEQGESDRQSRPPHLLTGFILIAFCFTDWFTRISAGKTTRGWTLAVLFVDLDGILKALTIHMDTMQATKRSANDRERLHR